MKSTGIVRRVDELGRIVLPIEIRRVFDIKVRDSLEMYTEGDKLILKKYTPACIFCGEMEDTIAFEDKLVCQKCYEKMKAFFDTK